MCRGASGGRRGQPQATHYTKRAPQPAIACRHGDHAAITMTALGSDAKLGNWLARARCSTTSGVQTQRLRRQSCIAVNKQPRANSSPPTRTVRPPTEECFWSSPAAAALSSAPKMLPPVGQRTCVPTLQSRPPLTRRTSCCGSAVAASGAPPRRPSQIGSHLLHQFATWSHHAVFTVTTTSLQGFPLRRQRAPGCFACRNSTSAEDQVLARLL